MHCRQCRHQLTFICKMQQLLPSTLLQHSQCTYITMYMFLLLRCAPCRESKRVRLPVAASKGLWVGGWPYNYAISTEHSFRKSFRVIYVVPFQSSPVKSEGVLYAVTVSRYVTCQITYQARTNNKYYWFMQSTFQGSIPNSIVSETMHQEPCFYKVYGHTKWWCKVCTK